MCALTRIPVVLFTYRRPDTVSRVIESLRADAVPLLHVFSDGPRNAEVAGEVAAVRRLIRSVDWCDCKIIERSVNLGLGISVKEGVAEILRQYKAAIFFEDDLVCVPGTYKYLVEALHHYGDDETVMSVTGWTHPCITPSNVGTMPYFDGKGECWVWGTWARSWKGMEMPAIEIMAECHNAGINTERYGTDMPKMASEAEAKNLWAVGWWYHHMRNKGLCLRPPWSMVEHICWEQKRSTTTTAAMQVWANPPLLPCPPIPVQWPEPVEHCDCAALWRASIDGT